MDGSLQRVLVNSRATLVHGVVRRQRVLDRGDQSDAVKCTQLRLTVKCKYINHFDVAIIMIRACSTLIAKLDGQAVIFILSYLRRAPPWHAQQLSISKI